MSNALDSVRLSDIIQSATQEIVTCTESFLQSVKEEPVGPETITVMLNGKKTNLSRENYNLLKSQTEEIKVRMRAEMKAISAQFKTDSKK